MKFRNFGLLSVSAMMLTTAVSFADDFQAAGPGGGDGGKAPVCYPAMTIDKDGPEHVYWGDDLRYKITVTNTGTCYLTGIRLVDILPEKVEFDRARPEEDDVRERDDQEHVIWRHINLAPGESREFKLKAEFRKSESGLDKDRGFELVNRACVTHPWFADRICDEAETEVRKGKPPTT